MILSDTSFSEVSFSEYLEDLSSGRSIEFVFYIAKDHYNIVYISLNASYTMGIT